MPDSGWQGGVVAANRDAGTSWATVNNVLVNDANDASVTLAALGSSAHLYVSDFVMTSIPTDATIVGVEVRVWNYGTASGNFDHEWLNISLVVGDTNGTENKNTELPFPGDPDQIEIVGSPTDLWSEALTRNNVQEGTDFGVIISVVDISAASTTTFIGFIDMKIHYEIPTVGQPMHSRRHVGFVSG